jgi:dipeptidyl-peptidase-4
LRSNTLHEETYDHPWPGIAQSAEGYPYMDVERVGAVECGSILTAVSGLLLYPDFYKVGVSQNAQLDSRLFACIATKDEGYPELEDFAGNLKGKLLLIHGMLEDVMTPAMVFRLVEALQRANKRFDMLLLPCLGHGSSSYTIQRSWDYVVEHLLGEEPPEDFKLKTVYG